MNLIRYVGLLRSPASWAAVGRGLVPALRDAGRHVCVVERKGFLYDPAFALPEGLAELCRDRREARLDLAFLHPRLYGELRAPVRAGMLTWEASAMPGSWARAVEKNLHVLFVPSPFVEEAARKAGVARVPIHVVPYGVDARVFHPGALAFTWPELLARGAVVLGDAAVDLEGRFAFLTVGAPHHRKGILEVAEGYARAFRREDRVLLVVKTSYVPEERKGGALAFEVRDLAGKIGKILAGSGLPAVFFRGVLSDAEQARLYRTAQAYVCASFGEGFGLSVLEAKACGVPVLATLWGGVASFSTDADTWAIPYSLEDAREKQYDDAAGALVARPDVGGIASAMRAVLEAREPARRARVERGLEVAKGFGWARCAREVIARL
ncbi:MAG: glycosyltransferase [Planctomycetota bacterium]